MNKSAKKRTKSQPLPPSQQRTLRLAAVVRANLYAFVIREGMKALDEMLEQDRERMCGPAHGKGGENEPVRWGHAAGRLVMGGQRVLVRKPRVRHEGKEVALPTWAQFADEDPLDERTFEQLVLGVSTRSYKRSIEPVPHELFRDNYFCRHTPSSVNSPGTNSARFSPVPIAAQRRVVATTTLQPTRDRTARNASTRWIGAARDLATMGNRPMSGARQACDPGSISVAPTLG